MEESSRGKGKRQYRGGRGGGRRRRHSNGYSNDVDSKPYCNSSHTRSTNTNNSIKSSAASWKKKKGKKKLVGVPELWEEVENIGSVVRSTCFIPCKVFLDHNYKDCKLFRNKSLTATGTVVTHWSPTMFKASHLDSNFKMVIDLTNTTKYYDGKKEFNDSSIKYVKLAVEGFKSPPTDAIVSKFFEIVSEFHNDGLIAVHCTHGLNRTGYLIVSYLVLKAGFTVTDALSAFKDARPPGLVKRSYIDALYAAHGGTDESVCYPIDLPEWAAKKYSTI